MTPKEKADHLWFKFDEIIALNSWADEKTNIEEHVLLPKKCALLLVNQIIQALPPCDYGLEFVAKIQYWLDVKIELEAL